MTYKSPSTLADLLSWRTAHPHAQIVAGCTDVGLWVNKLHMDFEQVLDVSRVHELRQISSDAQHLHIGAAVSLTDAFAALEAERPQFHSFTVSPHVLLVCRCAMRAHWVAMWSMAHPLSTPCRC